MENLEIQKAISHSAQNKPTPWVIAAQTPFSITRRAHTEAVWEYKLATATLNQQKDRIIYLLNWEENNPISTLESQQLCCIPSRTDALLHSISHCFTCNMGGLRSRAVTKKPQKNKLAASCSKQRPRAAIKESAAPVGLRCMSAPGATAGDKGASYHVTATCLPHPSSRECPAHPTAPSLPPGKKKRLQEELYSYRNQA